MLRLLVLSFVYLFFSQTWVFAQDPVCSYTPDMSTAAVCMEGEGCYLTGSGEIVRGSQNAQPLAAGAHFALADLTHLSVEDGLAIFHIWDDVTRQSFPALLWGDSILSDRRDDYYIAVSASATANIAVRGAPSVNGGVRAGLQNGQAITVEGISQNGEWLHIVLDDANRTSGWAARDFIRLDNDQVALPIINADGSNPNIPDPLKALSIDVTDGSCGGLLLTVPDGVIQTTLTINGSDLWFTPGHYLMQTDGETFGIQTLSGQSWSVESLAAVFVAGSDTRLTLSAGELDAVTTQQPLTNTSIASELASAAELDIIFAEPASEDILALSDQVIAPPSDLTLSYACISSHALSLRRAIESDEWTDIDVFSGCRGSMTVSSATGFSSSFGPFRAWLPTDTPIVHFPSMRVTDATGTNHPPIPAWSLVPAGVETITVGGRSVQAWVYTGGYVYRATETVDNPATRQHQARHYYAPNGVLLRFEIIERVISCAVCTSNIPIPHTSREIIYELETDIDF